MSTALRALIVEDLESDCDLLVRSLRKGGYEVSYQRVDSAESLNTRLTTGEWDIVISDYSMPGFSGTAALKIVRERGLDVPFIFVSGTIGEETAVEAMRLGANDYVMKGNAARLLPAIRRELEDIARRRQHKSAEQRVRQLEKFEAIGKLAGGIAHDFNNVIGAVLGWAELGITEAPAESRTARYFHKIREQSQRAAGLTRQLLAYARRQILEPKNIELSQLIIETVALLRRVIGEHIEVRMVLAPAAQVVRADPSQLEQVLMNLCLNARDAMPRGGQLLIETQVIELDSEYCKLHGYARPGKHVKLSISDTGTGMDGATVERIFEPFFTTKEVGEGTGLGLATALGIVKQHEGSIEVQSELGKGTAFHVYLPASNGIPESRHCANDSPVRGGTETILVAEDNDGMRQMMREALESLGYRVLLAEDGEEAIEKFSAHRQAISLTVLDILMPRLSGPDVYARICKLAPGLPVIFTSGYSEQRGLPLSSNSTNAVLLQKPFDSKALGRKIRELLDKLEPAKK